MVADTIKCIREKLNRKSNEKVHLIGHSTGGKLCAVVSLQYPDLVESVVLLDVMPLAFPETSWRPIRKSIYKINDIPIDQLQSKADIHLCLEEVRMSAKLRTLLSSSTVDQGGNKYSWNFDIKKIVEDLEPIQGFPRLDCTNGSYDGHVLLIRADTKKSFYVQEKDMSALFDIFPRVGLAAVAGSGHWLHSEAPGDTAKIIASFYAQIMSTAHVR